LRTARRGGPVTATGVSARLKVEILDARVDNDTPITQRPLLETRWVMSPPETGDHLTLQDGTAVVVVGCRLDYDDQGAPWFAMHVRDVWPG
jgi:hypothetical protein